MYMTQQECGNTHVIISIADNQTFGIDSILCSFVMTQKNEKVQAGYKFHTSVRLGNLAKQGLMRKNIIRAAREAGVLLRTCPRRLPSATDVMKFL